MTASAGVGYRPLMLSFKPRRSAGIPVTPSVHRLIRAGDAARDRGLWAEAATGYRGALTRAPELAHIRVQLGHALVQSGDLAGAAAVYREAAALGAGPPSPGWLSLSDPAAREVLFAPWP